MIGHKFPFWINMRRCRHNVYSVCIFLNVRILESILVWMFSFKLGSLSTNVSTGRSRSSYTIKFRTVFSNPSYQYFESQLCHRKDKLRLKSGGQLLTCYSSPLTWRLVESIFLQDGWRLLQRRCNKIINGWGNNHYHSFVSSEEI